jgi:Response regulator of the LytR/AlgR family
MLRVVIADDNEGMRLVLRKAVEKAGHQVVGEAANGEEAVTVVEAAKPDVLFIDVEMPGTDGVEAARRIQDLNPRVAIVFATAHEEYRKEAFEVYAYDYLMKPFAIERIAETLDRLDQQQQGDVLPPLLEKKAEPLRKVDKLLVRHKDGISLVKMEDVVLIQRENRATAIYTATEKHISNETLSELEQRLPSPPFFRAHKSYIINVDHITRIYPYGRWTYIVKFEGTDMDALMTQERYGLLQKYFS